MRLSFVQVSLGCLTLACGCSRLPWFPAQPLHRADAELAFDVDGDGRADYWQSLDPAGQKVELRFDTNGDGQADQTVRPAELAPEQCLHVIVVLDGVPCEVIEELYAEDRFRLFPPPSRVISVFPVMTDLALARVFTDDTCLGYEALYYDRTRKSLSDGNGVYLRGANEPWGPCMDYRCSTLLDAQAYMNPSAVWRHELGGILRTIRAKDRGTLRVYSVATAGLATRGGRDAVVSYLKTVDQMCEQLTYERRGRIRFTLFADHGHDLTPGKRAHLDRPLRQAGYRLTHRLKGRKDVVWPQFGLVSCAILHTDDPQGVADALVGEPSVDLVAYLEPTRLTPSPSQGEGWGEGCRDRSLEPGPSPPHLTLSPERGEGSRDGLPPRSPGDPPAGDAVVVRSAGGSATIRRVDDRFSYVCQTGDPLKLQPVMDNLSRAGKLAADGSAADRDWLAATADHEYPDPLWRVWSAFHDLVQNPADVIVSLREGYFCGSKLFSLVADVASTHGALSRRGSVTFAMSNDATLPAVLRIEDLKPFVRTNPAER